MWKTDMEKAVQKISDCLPLFSVIVLIYNNEQYAYQAIDSVLLQDYPNIELIVVDDGSKMFHKEDIEHYIEAWRRGNISRAEVVAYPENVGTVRQINRILDKISGKYLKLLAADDFFYDRHSLGQLEDCLSRREARIVISRVLRFEEGVKGAECLLPSPKEWKRLRNYSSKQLYERLCFSNLIGGTGVAFHHSLFEEGFRFDESFRLTEDWPTWLRFCRTGEKIEYLDCVTVKYRGGGISSGDPNALTDILYQDLVQLYEKEILVHLEDVGIFCRRHSHYVYQKLTKYPQMRMQEKMLFLLCFGDVLLVRKILALLKSKI